MWDRQNKNKVRQEIIALFPKNVSSFLDIPAEEMKSTIAALDQKVINKNTRCLFVEEVAHRAKRIGQLANTLGIKHHSTFKGKLQTLTNLPAFVPPLQAGNFDTCNTPNLDILHFLDREISSKDWWAKDGVFAFTFQEVPRGSQYWYDAFCETIGKKLTFPQTADALIRCGLWKYNLKLLWTCSYHDRNEIDKHRPTMNVFVYRNMGHATQKQADINIGNLYKTVLTTIKKDVPIMAKKKKSAVELSAIANRAVATRKANQEKARRSEIANRAVAKRRKNAKAKA